MNVVFIYALLDPITGVIRYIGVTGDCEVRAKKHLQEAKSQKTHRACWIRSLLALNLKPELEVLAQVPESDWRQWEIDYIAAFRSLGFDLVNGTDGGDGLRNPSLEVRAKISAAWTGRKHTPETREKQRAAKLGTKLSLAHCENIRAGIKQYKKTPEHRANLSTAHLAVAERKKNPCQPQTPQ